MKKILSIIVLLAIMVLPSELLAAGNVAKIGTNEYATIAEAVENAVSGNTIEVLASATTNDLTLESGITLNIPEGKTLTLTGNTVAKAGANVKNNGLIVVDNGTLDVSALGYSSTAGLIPGQSGLITIKSTGRVKMLNVWGEVRSEALPDGWKPTVDSHILTNCESGATIEVIEKTFVYDGSAWKGAFEVGTTQYETFAEAFTAATKGSTIKLLADVIIPSSTEMIGKDVNIDLNGHTLAATNRVLTIQHATVNITGTGTIKELTPSTAPIVLKGSNNAADKNYTVVTIGENVTLEGYCGAFVTPYVSKVEPYAYGAVLNINGTIKSLNNSSNETGYGVYVNGQIQHTDNYPIININKTAKITSTGSGVYAAGYAKWNINGSSLTGIESGVAIKSGLIILNGTTVKATGVDTTPTQAFSDGVNASGAAIQIESNSSYKGNIELTINGGVYTSEKGVSLYEYLATNKDDTSVKSIVIDDGTFTAGTAKDVIKVSSEFAKKHIDFIKGGTYTSNPATYVAVGYKNVINEGKYEVSKIDLPVGTKTISGTITNGNNATVQLKQGGIVLKTTLASDTGEYSFTNVAAGIYNIVAINGTQSTMKVVQMGTENIALDMTVPESGSVTFVVVGESTPNIVVGGLDTVGATGEKITLAVSLETPDSEIKNSIEKKINDDKKNVMYLDITLGGNEEFITETEGMLEIIVPFDLSNNKNIELYRSHDGVTSALTKLSEKPETKADGTYYLDIENNLIYIYANKFSTYAIAYANIANPKTGDNVLLYIALSAISLVAIAGSTVYLNKRKLVAIK